VQIRILGAAAGGGVPQWNCRCRNCRAARSEGRTITQSSAVVSGDGTNWFLLNASPDLGLQFGSFGPLAPQGRELRGGGVRAVILTDGELDHATGLISLREQKSLTLICTDAVKNLLTVHFRLLPALEKYCRIEHSKFPVEIAGIRVTALELKTDKAPPYAGRSSRDGDVAAVRLESDGKSWVYIPGLPSITAVLNAFVAGCDCLLVDGTFWSQEEMTSLGLSKRNASEMGHVQISGRGGSLEWLRTLDIPRKIYTHINNTNPILRNHSRERRLVELAGVEISEDGMEIRL
jgi:pyrroloquinoline quinone biosynthesis protein B